MNHRPRNSAQRPSRHRRRLIGVQAAFVLTFGVIAWRIHYVQHVFGPSLTAQANQVQDANRVLMAPRGALLDRNGQRLAYDVPAYFMDVKTEAFSNLGALAKLLAPNLETTPDKLLPALQKGKHWVRWPNPVLEPVKEKILAALDKDHQQAVTFTPAEQRFYPYGMFAANTIGFVDHEGVGKAGLEAEYNQVLSGTNGQISYVQDRWGFPLQTSVKTTKPAVPGEDIELTIDQTIQGFVEQDMNYLVTKYKPEHAAIVVEDPNTGEILGMASRPSFDPNTYWAAQDPKALSENWGVNVAFEPGSTFKAITLTAGLATHAISLDQTFMSGHMYVNGQQINDWKPSGWGVLNYQGALEYSSNVGFATVALKLGWANLFHYMKSFGLLNKTGIDLPAEGNSITFNPSSNTNKIELATSGFGQGNAITPIQQIAAYGAIANGGKLLRPHLAKAFLDPATGKVIKSVEPVVANPQVAPPDVIQQVNESLNLDVSKGIDDIAKIPGYDVAGKTGTANTVDPITHKYYADRYDVSFIGYAPGYAPKFEVLVTLDWPKTSVGNQWGSTIAAPTARDLLKQCLEYAHIPPSNPSTVKASTANVVKAMTHYVQTPNLVGQSVKQAEDTLRKLGLVANLIGRDGQVENQWPRPGIEVSAGSKMYLSLSGSKGQAPFMPDLTGTSMREAGDILTTLGVNMVPQGTGFAVGQSLKAGQPVQAGTTVTIQFQPPKDPVDEFLGQG